MTRYVIHNLIEVRVDERVPSALAESIEFQLGHFRVPADGDPTTDPSRSRITVRPYGDFSPDAGPSPRQFHRCRGVEGRWLDLPMRRTAYVFGEARGASVIDAYADSPAMLVNLLIQLQLIERGMTLIHAAAAADESGRVTLLPGPGGVGKTALLGELVKQRGYRLLGDDLVILTADGRCLSFPRGFVLKAYHASVYPALFAELGLDAGSQHAKSRGGAWRAAMNLLADNVPCKGLIRWALRRAGRLEAVRHALADAPPPPYLAAVPVERIFGRHVVADEGRLHRVVFLERHEGDGFDVTPMRHAAMVNRLLSIVHHEWVGHMLDLWSLGSLELVDLPSYYAGVAEIASSALSHHACRRLLIPRDASPAALCDAFARLDTTPLDGRRAA